MSTCKLHILRVHYDSRHRTISQELMCLPEGVRIPLNYNVIDFTQRICLDEKRVCTHCMSTRVHVSLLRMYDDARTELSQLLM